MRESRPWAPMTLVISTSYLLKEGPVRFLVLFGGVCGVGFAIGYPVWRYRRMHNLAYAARRDELTRTPWSVLALALLVSGTAIAVTPGWWRVVAVLAIAGCALFVRSGAGGDLSAIASGDPHRTR